MFFQLYSAAHSCQPANLFLIDDRTLFFRIALFDRKFGRNNDNPLGTPLSSFSLEAGGEGVDPELLIHRDIVPVCLGLLPSCAEPSASRCHRGMHLNITGKGAGRVVDWGVGGGLVATCGRYFHRKTLSPPLFFSRRAIIACYFKWGVRQQNNC